MITFKSYYDLSRDIAANISKISTSPDIVVGIPKSGMIPATIIASFLNAQLIDLDSFLFSYSVRSGVRRHNKSNSEKLSVLFVDDSVNTGAEFERVRQKVAFLGDNLRFQFCAVYGLAETSEHADVVLAEAPQPRVFQWNYRNHIIAEHALFDMDGVLCVDPDESVNDDGPLYTEFVLNAKPLFIPKKQISAIVTSRLEKFRQPTEQWLRSNGVKYKELIMLDLPTAEERRRLRAHAPFKTEVYKSRPELVFIESNWKQARHIAEHADKPVICTENDAFIYGRNHLKTLKSAGQEFSYEGLNKEAELHRQIARLKRQLQEGHPGISGDTNKANERQSTKNGRMINVWQQERIIEDHLKQADRKQALLQPDSKFRLLLISTSFDTKRGAGAATSSHRLKEALKCRGHEVFELSNTDFDDNIHISPDSPISTPRLAFWNLYHNPTQSRRLGAKVDEVNPDAIILGAVDRGIVSIFDLAALKYPIVWVGRDNWLHTGGCLFQLEQKKITVTPKSIEGYLEALNCGAFKTGCNDCPAFSDKREGAKARLQFELKNAVFGFRRDIVFAPISKWLESTLKSSPLTADNPIRQVYKVIDLESMRPLDVDRSSLRDKYHIPRNKKVVLLAAHSLANPRKGIQLIYDALADRNDFSDTVFIQMGTGTTDSVPESIRSMFIALGFIEQESDKVELYNAADITLVPALQESLSVVATDSLCCGTPVAAFGTSGFTDYIESGVNGYLAVPFDGADLLNGVRALLDRVDQSALRGSARSSAVEKFDAKKNVESYEEVVRLAISEHEKIGSIPKELSTLEEAFSILHGDLEFRSTHMRYQAKLITKLKSTDDSRTSPKGDSRLADSSIGSYVITPPAVDGSVFSLGVLIDGEFSNYGLDATAALRKAKSWRSVSSEIEFSFAAGSSGYLVMQGNAAKFSMPQNAFVASLDDVSALKVRLRSDGTTVGSSDVEVYLFSCDGVGEIVQKSKLKLTAESLVQQINVPKNASLLSLALKVSGAGRLGRIVLEIVRISA